MFVLMLICQWQFRFSPKIHALPRHNSSYTKLQPRRGYATPSGPEGSSTNSFTRQQNLRDQYAKQQQEAYARRNKSLLMYTSAVVRLHSTHQCLRSHWLPTHHSSYLDCPRNRCHICCCTVIQNVLCRHRFCWDAQSRHGQIRG